MAYRASRGQSYSKEAYDIANALDVDIRNLLP